MAKDKQGNSIQAVVFDLGGVLVDLNGMRSLIGLCPHVENETELHSLWTRSETVRAFESGRMEFDEFCRAVTGELSLDMEEREFSRQFKGFLGDPRPDIEAVLDSIEPGIRRACLSNTNPIHYEVLNRKTSLLERFDLCCLSFQTGLMKPDEETYCDLCRKLALPPGSILFLDDNSVNVTGARDCGIRAEQVRSMADIRKHLLGYGVIPGNR